MRYFAFLFLFLCFSCTKKNNELKDLPIALANIDGTIISVDDFQAEFNRTKESYDSVSLQINEENLAVLKKSLLNQMITKVILLREAQKLNIIISDNELDEYLLKTKSQYTKEEFDQMLKAKKLSFANWVMEQKQYLALEKLTREIVKNAKEPAIEDLKNIYNKNLNDKYKKKPQVRVQQIVVGSENEATDILSKIKGGAQFSDMAKTYSLSPDGQNGGDVGWLEKGQKIPEFDEAFSLKVGELSRVIKSSYGFHILKVVEMKPATTLTFDQVKDEIKNTLMKEAKEAAYKTWLEKKIAEAKIFQNNEILSLIK